jgi:hypothetical protein
MKKLTIGVIFLLLIICPTLATNVFKIGNYQVLPSTDLLIQLEATNTIPFVAFQVDIPVPEGFRYVVGSAQLNSSRISGHVLTASLQAGNVLRLIGYSASNSAFTGSSGTIVSFYLQSGTAPGDYTVAIKDGILSDNQTKNTLTSSTNGKVSVLCSNIQSTVAPLDFGRVPLGTVAQQSVVISNSGNRDLIISGLTFNDPQFSTADPTSFTVLPGGKKTITIKFKPIKKGNFDNLIQIKSNDPDQAETNISLKAVAFAVNELHTGNLIGASSTTGKLEFTINNMEPFTGFQFDVIVPKPMSFIPGTAQLFRMQDHVVAVSQINDETVRVASYSPTNKSFIGIDGKILGLDFSLNGVAGWYPVTISNVIISDKSGENIISASSNGSLQITSPDIDTESQLNFGDISILAKGTKNQRVYNHGQEILTISQLLFSSDYFSTKQSLPVTVSPNSFVDIQIEFAKSAKGLVNETLKIISNDPDENPFTVTLSAKAIAPNQLQIGQQGILIQETKLIPVEISNEEPFVAFQFDLKYPVGLTPVLNGIVLSDRKKDHVVAATLQGQNTLRIVAYSPSQQSYSGKTGTVVSIPFKAEANLLPGTYNLELSNGILSDQSSENILYSMHNGKVIIQKSNYPPISNPGNDQYVNKKDIVTLNGKASSDPEGNSLTYKWTAPTGIILNSTTVFNPTFSAPGVTKDSVIIFSLVVNDGFEDSAPSEVKIFVKNEITDVELPLQNAVKVYPNPFKNELIIETDENVNSIEFEIINSLGQSVIMGKMKECTVIQTNSFNPGMYLVKLKSGGTYEFKKIIKK